VTLITLLFAAGFAIAGAVVFARRHRIAAANLESVNGTGRRAGKPTTVGAVVFVGAVWVLVGVTGVIVSINDLIA
jgi:hypothetical protein